MGINYRLLVYVFLCLITNTSIILTREYCIKENVTLSYLYYGKDNIEEEIFPEDITINTSISKVTGTLLYSIDKNMNQLIVSLRNGLPHMIDIELNKQQFSVSLSSLCGCERCRYETLELRIQINDYINIQCNGGKIQKEKNKYGKELKENYPISNSDKSLMAADANMWLVNYPQCGNILPNALQMYGCILSVAYNEQSIIFTNVTPNIEKKCNKTCIGDICNGGQCYETYGTAPICNCSTTFRNGLFCNDTVLPINARLLGKNPMFEMFKVSWNSSVNKIFELKNKYVRLLLGHENKNLFIDYESKKVRKIQTKAIIFENYVPNTEYVCIGYFHNRNIDIRLLNNGSWYNTLIPTTNCDMGREVFDSVLLRSGDGYIEMNFMDSQEYRWRKLPIGNNIEIEYDELNATVTNITDDQKDQRTYIIHELNASVTNITDGAINLWIIIPVSVIAGVLAITAVIMFVLYRRKVLPISEDPI